jgi:predicted AAA+ superfamily ATPase
MVDRFAGEQAREALADTPVVIIQGPRQSGKTTLARQIGGGLPYVTLDDSTSLDAATRSPSSFLKAYPEGLILDEVQRAPKLFRSIKAAVDRDRRPGRFLITGSSNILLNPKLTESLAGRMETITLWPFSEAEIEGADPDLSWLFGNDRPPSGSPFDLDRLAEGGFPEPHSRKSASRQRAWFDAYLKAILERDVRDLADIEGLAVLPRLIRSVADSVGETLNQTTLSRSTGIPATTLKRYLALLDAVFLTTDLPAWQSGLSHRVIKSSKVIFGDTGIACRLLNMRSGAFDRADPVLKGLLTSFIVMELKKTLPRLDPDLELSHFRSIRQYEVPIVIAQPDGGICGIDICLDPIPEGHSYRALEFLKELAGDRFVRGVVLTLDGESGPYTDRLWTAPISSLWSS